MKVDEAKQIVSRGDGRWDGPKRIIRYADSSKRSIWKPVGKAPIYSDGQPIGPKFCTLQLI